MKKILLIILTAIQVHAVDLNEEDKQKHLAATFAISFTASNIAYYYGFDELQSAWIGFGTGILVGLGKEAYDSRDGGTGFSSADMSANVIGSAFGASTIFFIYKF